MKHSRRRCGFSLVEVLCAVLILGLGVAGLTQGVATALRSSRESEVQTRAVMVAAGRIELLRADGYLTEGETEGAGNREFELYRWQELVFETEIDGLYEVVVTVRNADSGATLCELRTLLFDPPLSAGLESSEGARGRDRPRGRRRGRG